MTALLILFAFPPLTAALAMLFIDRHLGGDLLRPGARRRRAILWQHLFWFFGHPEVYILDPAVLRGDHRDHLGLQPASRSSATPRSSSRRSRSPSLSMTVWAHHMFTTGAVSNPFFSLASFAIAVPTGIKFFNWIATMWRGQLTFETPMLWAIGLPLPVPARRHHRRHGRLAAARLPRPGHVLRRRPLPQHADRRLGLRDLRRRSTTGSRR